MAAVKSLGLHTPSALAHLIAESLLPPDPAPHLYTWETYINGVVEEEILFTSSCVAWSQGRVIRKIFSFSAEDEKVQHALLTWFPAHEAQDDLSQAERPLDDIMGQFRQQNKSVLASSTSIKDSKASYAPARALVVLLQYQAHIFFLSGASHLIKLPFEVDRAFPAPKGLILQRKLGPVFNHDSQTTLGQPGAPQNSFQSPASLKSFQSFQSVPISFRLSKAQGYGKDYNSKLNFSLLESLSTPNDESIPRLFSLTSPLSEFSLVVRTPSNNPDFWVASSRATKSLESLESSEELLYISPSDESPPTKSLDAAQLLLAVTIDREKGVYSIWNASYLDSKPISKVLTGGSTPTHGLKNRRRSSFVTTTGNVTPAIRSRDNPRDSLGMTTSKSTIGKKKSSKKKDLASLKEAEDTLASQIDPEFEPRRTARESRRVSSMISRADLNPSFDRSAFQDLASQHGGTTNSLGQHGRRGHSLGNASEKGGFGTTSQRRLRASTPGAFSRLSIEDISDIGGGTPIGLNGSQASTTFEDYEMLADITAHNDDLDGFDLQAPLDGLKKEVLVSKFAEIPIRIGSSNEPKASATVKSINTLPPHQRMKVFTMLSPINCEENGPYGRRFFLYIFNHDANECIQVEFSVRHKNSQNSTDDSQDPQKPTRRAVPMPSFRSVSRLNDIADALKISDGHQARMLFLRNGRSGQSSVWVFSPWSPETPTKVPLHRLRVFNPYDIASYSTPVPRGVGVRRSFVVPRQLIRLTHAGPNGLFDIVSTDHRPHRLVLQLWPRNTTVSKIMELILSILPLSIGEKILCIWWNRHNTFQNTLQKEWHALAISLYTLFLACEGDKRKRRPRKNTDLASVENRTALMQKFETSWNTASTQTTSAWLWALQPTQSKASVESSPPHQRIGTSTSPSKLVKIGFLKGHVASAREFMKSGESRESIEALRNQRQAVIQSLPRLMTLLHLTREEMKLDSTSCDTGSPEIFVLAPVIAQLGRWLDWPDWDWKESRYYHYELSEAYDFEDMSLFSDSPEPLPGFESPPSILSLLEEVSRSQKIQPYQTLDKILSSQVSNNLKSYIGDFTPRIRAILDYFVEAVKSRYKPDQLVEAMVASGVHMRMVETFPEALLAIFKESIVQCQANPSTTWSAALLAYVSREDLNLRIMPSRLTWMEGQIGKTTSNETIRDIHTITQSVESTDQVLSFPNSDRMAISRLIFNQDRRFTEAIHMIEPYRIAVAECVPGPDWTEAQNLEAQREVHNWVMTRTFSLAPGLGFAHYDSRVPLLSEKFTIHGYNTLCVMKPLNNTVSVDRSNFSEERYAWAWFHAGVAAGLSISKNAKGIDSSWVVFNRPSELNNRHAGLLLALGLNGHLKSMAKWLSFKYLTPKHTMTSIGILLGLSASHLGTMDTLVTRLLSVHVTRMLPPGAAELNLSSLTQTAGLMGIGLLYYNTQHRRMSEVMLSEIENMESEDLSGAAEPLRDESYRLCAAFALGLINLGQGSDLKGLHDLRLVERLLAIAVGPRRINFVHLIDQATAGATIAIMLVFMKTGNKAIASKIDIPDTIAQFDFVRPDILLLRTLGKHLILWDNIRADYKWIINNLPKEYAKIFDLRQIKSLNSEHMPFYNILSGLLWSISLKYAGSGDIKARDFLISYLDQFIRLSRLSALRYDSRLTRNTVRNCQDLVSLSAATVMAGTGDLELFRRFRSLHGRVNPDTPYGSHMAAHMALGALFFGAGCYTFGTSNLAIASLIIAFYPVFPMDVTDNKAHLQAFRHFWALAAEPRCIIPRDIDTGRAISLDLMLHMRDGSIQRILAPQLLPDLTSIGRISSLSSEYWPVTLDFASNPAHLTSFRQTQTIHVRRRPAHEAHSSPFTATLATANDARSAAVSNSARETIFRLSAFADFEITDFGALLETGERGSAVLDLRGGYVDEWLLLGTTARRGWNRERLWNLKILLAWAERLEMDGQTEGKWIRKEVLDRWKSIVEERARSGSNRD